MIDLHSHILPGLDDGASGLEESLAMARMAVESGVSAVVATPHCMDGRAGQVLDTWLLLREALDEFEIPLELLLGMEIFGTDRTLELLRQEKLVTLNGTRHPLVEFGFHSDGVEETRILRELCRAGYVPLVAHPERYRYVQLEPRVINTWRQMGCLFQVNRGSLLGRFGRGAREMAYALVARGFADAVASDAHGMRMRTPWMRDVRQLLTDEFSDGAARDLLTRNPANILRNKYQPSAEPKWFSE